jgi:hypothetical protein
VDDLEALLRRSGQLAGGQPIPVAPKDRIDSEAEGAFLQSENGAVLALSLRFRGLAALPESLGGLTRLVELDLRNNRLGALPESIGQLDSLVSLDLRGNRLRALPPSIGALPHLEKLDLRWNKLSSLPGWIQQLERRGCTVFT